MIKQNRGLFIVFEGIDGSGKTTQLKRLIDYLFDKNKYNHILITREPYKSIKIREILQKDSDPYSKSKELAKLFIKDRKEHIKNLILPNLKKGIYVLSDRYKYSTIIYQSAQGLPIKELIKMHNDVYVPDLTLIFDVPVTTAISRMSKDKRQEQKFEKNIEFQEKLRQSYLNLPKILSDENIVIINADRDVEEVNKDVISAYEKLINPS